MFEVQLGTSLCSQDPLHIVSLALLIILYVTIYSGSRVLIKT